MSALLQPRESPLPLLDDTALAPPRLIGDLDVVPATGEAVIAFLARRIEDLRFTPVAFANAHCVNIAAKDESYRGKLSRFLVLPDGIGVDLASKLLYGAPFPENLNGTDFVPRLFEALSGGRRIALVGAGPGVAQEAAAKLARRFPQHEIRAISDGFFKPGLETEIVLARLRDFSPDVTLVALGVPGQEHLISDRLTIRETTIAIGVGALFDFLSGRVQRAPRVWRSLRLEWAFRLALEPSRLWRRYVLGNPQFLYRVYRQSRRQGAPVRPATRPA